MFDEEPAAAPPPFVASGQDMGLMVPSVGVVVSDRERGLVLRIDAALGAEEEDRVVPVAAVADAASSPILLLVDEVLTPDRRLKG